MPNSGPRSLAVPSTPSIPATASLMAFCSLPSSARRTAGPRPGTGARRWKGASSGTSALKVEAALQALSAISASTFARLSSALAWSAAAIVPVRWSNCVGSPVTSATKAEAAATSEANRSASPRPDFAGRPHRRCRVDGGGKGHRQTRYLFERELGLADRRACRLLGTCDHGVMAPTVMRPATGFFTLLASPLASLARTIGLRLGSIGMKTLSSSSPIQMPTLTGLALVTGISALISSRP